MQRTIYAIEDDSGIISAFKHHEDIMTEIDRIESGENNWDKFLFISHPVYVVYEDGEQVLRTLLDGEFNIKGPTQFILFQADQWQTKSSYVYFGVFSSQSKAIEAAKENNLYKDDTNVVIKEVTLDQFEEL